MAGVVNKRPDLFGAVFSLVPVTDIMRCHLFTGGSLWSNDYGNSDIEQQVDDMLAYSPLHNVKKAKYPPMIVATADQDDRVVPLHAYKFVASLQYQTKDIADAGPILLRVAKDRDHAGGGLTWPERFNFL